MGRFPIECSTKTTLNFESLKNNTVRATVSTARNDPRLNAHNRGMIQNWRANVDIQTIVDMTACACYLTKYVAKCEFHNM